LNFNWIFVKILKLCWDWELAIKTSIWFIF
jgi:hypothetical protein